MFEYFINNVISTKNRPHDRFSSNTCSETLEILREVKKKLEKNPISSHFLQNFKIFDDYENFRKFFEKFQVQKSVEGADFERLEGPFFILKCAKSCLDKYPLKVNLD